MDRQMGMASTTKNDALQSIYLAFNFACSNVVYISSTIDFLRLQAYQWITLYILNRIFNIYIKLKA